MTIVIDANDPTVTLADILAQVSRGEEVTLAEKGVPVAKVLAVESPRPNSRESLWGSWKGKAWIADDFTAPLPEDELREWEK